MVLWTSLSPAFSESNLLVPMASNSSMKMMAGDFSLARAKASLTSLAPSPMNICTSCGLHITDMRYRICSQIICPLPPPDCRT